MGNYFSSSETKESINIINDIDDLNVIVSGSEEVKVKHENENENENEIKLNDFLNEQKQTKTDSNLLHLDVHVTDVTEKQTQLSVSDLLECAYKRKNMKKKKCKKNKKHLH
jgi:hypothetical protein